ncbi:hypothetical protein QZH41_011322 [Actinostola sp. cb2023]|nr:hypothetical protein QZH41_011322 [Actinostola sp. cb2023]
MPHHVNTATKMERSTPLHVAAGEGSVALMKILMQSPEDGVGPQKCNGIDLNARTSSGMTPLHLAATSGFVDVCMLLIEAKHRCVPPCRAHVKLDINAQSIMGRTALHDSITVGHKEVVKLLLKGGANVNLAYNPDQVIYNDELNNELSRVVRQLAEVVADKDKTPLGIACSQGNLEIVEILINAGAVDVNSACVEKAAKAHHHALVHLLLSRVASIAVLAAVTAAIVDSVNVDNEYKLPHSFRGGNHVDESCRMESNPVCIIWNGMKLTNIHPQWIVDAAKRINPQVAAGNIGLHPLPSLKILNISENSLSSLPSLHNGRVRPGNGATSVTAKKYHSCDNITDRIIEEEEDVDFTYAESSWNCPHLEEIEVHRNSLITLPTCIFQLPMLKFLNTAYNDIDTLPFAMWFAPVLKTLDLKGNYLKMLPLSKEVKRRPTSNPKPPPKTSNKPRNMSKSRDDISRELIPEQESESTDDKLPSTSTTRDQSSSKPKEDPAPPTKPQHLKIFCHSKLWGKNGLEELEDSDDEEEEYVGLTLQDIEPSVLERKKTKDLVSYLRSVLERSKPYPCMKLMFVGVSNIGKTTLLNQLRQEGTGSYQTSPSTGWTERQKRKKESSLGRAKKQDKNISTVGVDVSDWTYPKKNEFFRGDARQSIKFSTWDFGGQREYYATHQCFLSHRSLYIVMWKVTDGEKGVNEIEPWLLNIQARAPDSPCIIVGTHYDMLTTEEKRSNLVPDLQQMIKDRYIAREFGGGIQTPRDRGLPRVMNRIEVSSKTGYNVRELRHMIYKKAIEIKERGSRTPLVETPIPESYIQVEEVVGKIRENCYQDDQTPVMRSENFRNAIQKELEKQGKRLRDLEELQQATKFLHDNGVLLHYDDPLLRDLYFLDPQWLCDMLAHVVTVRQVNPHINNGVMKLSDLSLIFRSENFPANLIKQYINLLSKFEVALQWSSEYLLVPSLLPDRQPISNQPIAPGVSPLVTRAMNMAAYTKTRVLRRQYVMSYVPSGFWPRLITRVIADEEVRDVVRCCCQLVMEGEAVDADKEKLASVAQPDWSCWKTGVELSCFGVKMLRICDLEGYPFYGAPEDMFNPLQYRNEVHDPTSYSTIAIIAPCVNILMEKFVQKKKISKRRSTKSYNRYGDDDEDSMESRRVIGFRVKSVTDVGVQLAARLLAIVVEHFDTLITDWFPGLDALTVHGYRLVSRVIPCPKCITEISGVDADDISQEGRDSTGGVPFTHQNDSGAHLTTDGSSTSASPWPSPVHGAVTTDLRGDTTSSPVNKSNSQGSTASELTPDPTGDLPVSPPFIQVVDGSPPNRFTFKSVSSGLGTNDSSSYFEDTSDHSSESVDEQDTDGSEEPNTPQVRKGKNPKKKFFGSNESDRSRGSEEFNRRDSRASNSSSERRFGSQTDSQKSKGSTESTSSFNRSGRYGSFRRRPTENDKLIYAFEFEECVLCAYNGEPIKCAEHGQLNLKEIAPDVMFEDIAPHLSIHSGNLVRGKFLGKGTFGSVFRGELKGAAGDSYSIAMKMPLNNEVGEDAKPEERQAAEAAKRALADNPTMALNEAYRTVRQEISILLPLQHPNIVSLKGFCLSPLCMVLEFAPLGALDRILYNYKRAGARLNPYVVQKCIVQCASALKYLHKHHIIYRDLKSENILAWFFPLPHAADQAHHVVIKLADYGISRTAALAGIKGLGGTPGFMAPEIEKYVGKECYTDKVDTFSFGMYIYELITLHQPFCDLSPAQVKQMIVDGQRPPLSSKDRKAPVFAMDLMAWCWEQDSVKRPTSAQVYALASSPEFARLTDVLTFDKQLTINCAVTAGSRVNSGCGADGRPSIGNEVWFCRGELNNGIGTGKINVVKYSGGRFSHKEVSSTVCVVALKGLVEGDLAIKNTVEGDLAIKNTVEGDLAIKNTVEGDLAIKNTVEGDLAIKNTVEGDLAIKNTVEGDLAIKNTVEGDLAIKNTVEGDLAIKNTVEGDLAIKNTVEGDLAIKNTVEGDLAIKNTVEGDLAIKNTVEGDLAIKNTVEGDLAIKNTVEGDLAIKNTVEGDLAIKNTVEGDLAIKNTVEGDLAIKNTVEGDLAIKNTVEGDLAIKNTVEGDLAIKNTVEGDLAIKNTVEGDLAIKNGGRFSHKEELTIDKASVRVACSVGSTVWLGTESGTLHVYCAITYRELCKGVIKRAKYILNMVHIPRCNWVLVALADGSILAYNDNICNHYHYSDPGSLTPPPGALTEQGLPWKREPNPLHRVCTSHVPQDR